MRKQAIVLLLVLAAATLAASLAAAPPPKKPGTPAQAACPMDDMVVSTAKAPSINYKGKTYWFCSQRELAAFKKNPEKALNRKVPCAPCGSSMSFQLRDARTEIYKGKAYRMCSAACVAMFKKNPDKYGSAKPDAHEHQHGM